MRTRVLAAVAAVVAAVLTPATATAESMTVVAQGLDNPRGLAFDARGDLYVAEAGRGGAGPCFPGPEGGDVCFGDSGAITRVAGGVQGRVITGLPSIAAPDGSGAIGPSDVDPRDAAGVYFTVGLGADPAVRAGLPPLGQNASAWLLRGHHDGWQQVADIGAYEATANPDGGLPDTNPNSVTTVSGGRAVVDAGGNSLLLAHHHGISTLAVFDTRTIDGRPVQPVPTSVARGRDNALYVGELTGFPFPPGQARVHRVQPGQGSTVVAGGFTNIIDVAFDARGRLYVLEIAHHGLASGDPTGALIRLEHDGSRTTVASEGLIMPGGLTIRGGAAYVSNCSVCAGGGTVVRIPLG